VKKHLVSTLSGQEYPFDRIAEFADDGESLEVGIDGISSATVKDGASIWQRFSDFLPFDSYDPGLSLGEGSTPLLESGKLAEYTGVGQLLLKNETVNPTWSFKDRGSLPCVLMAREMGEEVVATISTGNMGASIAAYGARAGLRSIVFIPSFCPLEKIRPMGIHGATVVQVDAPDYGEMKRAVLGVAEKLQLRIVSGNGPIRVEGYKFGAFEMHEQLAGRVPDFIAVPTSACGHIRGLHKGYRELFEAGLVDRLPRMIIVQATNNSPLVTAFRQGKREPVPFTDFHTVAEAITTGNPIGGDEILDKAYRFDWLAEDVTEAEILQSQRVLAGGGFFVEPASATSLAAIKKLRATGAIGPEQSVVMMLTGAGLKDSDVFTHHRIEVMHSTTDRVAADVAGLL